MGKESWKERLRRDKERRSRIHRLATSPPAADRVEISGQRHFSAWAGLGQGGRAKDQHRAPRKQGRALDDPVDACLWGFCSHGLLDCRGRGGATVPAAGPPESGRRTSFPHT